MIDFHLDARSGVSPYLQLVQQVRQAVRLGLLVEGEQLPTVKEVVGQLPDQPEHGPEGLRGARARRAGCAPRPGIGTFVTPDPERRVARRPRATPPGPWRWLAKARQAGLDEESIEALFQESFRASTDEGVA